ncbi:hypothetical protein [Segniliparus rugosus]|uniref:Uncharacterized protein n=1 Tax=Segniliparus rugosus (strain ATCC BAA-974 / DSM 45345 / CCUG 50838 / CIP 108380 / JCM 13579 / CDC 945) TaxID=679197 RepID=E5XLN2_SEGRC|nr:hypothetical protein [Segniliparus rugosus]EFV14710.1 hypothetical protein HMPREF9336_00401 [Segniliparus rugosus ATCC BAA-974]
MSKNVKNKTADTVEELTSDMRGLWLVVTQGSRHIWDLETHPPGYVRVPGPQSLSGAFPMDRQLVRLSRVGRWPKIGGTSLVFFDVPDDPMKEYWRQSSAIARIERLPDPRFEDCL